MPVLRLRQRVPVAGISMHAGHAYPSLAEDTDDARGRDQAFGIHMLMAVEEDLRAGAFDVGVEGLEAHVHVVVPLMNQVRGIVRDKDVDRRKVLEGFFHFLLFVEEMALGFVTPGTVEPAEFQAVELVDGQVQIFDA